MESASDPIKLHYSRLIDLLETEPELILLVSNRLILINPIEIAKKYNSEEDKHTATVDNLIELLKDNGWVDISDIMNHYDNGEMVFEHTDINEGTIQRASSRRKRTVVKKKSSSGPNSNKTSSDNNKQASTISTH